MKRSTHLVIRKDRQEGTWWWVCIDEACQLDNGISLHIRSHRNAIARATSHLRQAAAERSGRWI